MNKEIQEFQESFFFGLSMRQCFFSVLAIAAAVGVYLGTKDKDSKNDNTEALQMDIMEYKVRNRSLSQENEELRGQIEELKVQVEKLKSRIKKKELSMLKKL